MWNFEFLNRVQFWYYFDKNNFNFNSKKVLALLIFSESFRIILSFETRIESTNSIFKVENRKSEKTFLLEFWVGISLSIFSLEVF